MADPFEVPVQPDTKTSLSKDEFYRLPVYIQEQLVRAGVTANDTSSPIPGEMPYTRHGAMNIRAEMPSRLMSNTLAGVHMQKGDVRDKHGDPNGGGAVIVTNARLWDDPKEAKYTRAHEMEHHLAAQALGSPKQLNALWDETVGKDGAKQAEIVQRVLAAAPHLVKNWGLGQEDARTGYFSPAMAKKNVPLDEYLASLSALEQSANRRLTDDPYIRANVLKTPAEREAYNALTGLRQTRLDAKDLPPYTRQPDKNDVPVSAAAPPASGGISALIKKFTGK